MRGPFSSLFILAVLGASCGRDPIGSPARASFVTYASSPGDACAHAAACTGASVKDCMAAFPTYAEVDAAVAGVPDADLAACEAAGREVAACVGRSCAALANDACMIPLGREQALCQPIWKLIDDYRRKK